MNNSAVGAAIIALCLGAVAWAVSLFGFDFSGALSVGIGIFVAVIAWILLWMGLGDDRRGMGVDARDLNAGSGTAPSSGSTASMASAAPAPAESAAAPAAAAAATAAVAAPAAAMASPAAEKAPEAAKPAAKKPAAKKPAAKKAAAKKPAAKTAAKSTAKPAAKASKPAAKPVAPDGKPEMLTKARAGGADDLKQIKGVGPKLEKMLNTMGVYHFDQVASWRKKEVEWVDDNLEGFKGRVSRDNWVSQAKTLAKGGQTEFSKKVKKGGVY